MSWPRRALVVAVYAGLLVAWEIYGRHNEATPGAVVVAPSTILQTIVDTRPALVINARTTLQETGVGLLLGTMVALAMSVAIDRFRLVGEGVYRLALMLHAIPLIAIAAPVVAWLGLGFSSKVVIAASGAYFPVLVNVTTALRTLDPRVAELGRTLALGYAETLFRLRAPAVLPAFFSSLKIAAPAAFVAAVIAEWMGAEAGIGVSLMNAMFGFQIPQLWAALVVASLLNGALVVAAGAIARVATPWHRATMGETA